MNISPLLGLEWKVERTHTTRLEDADPLQELDSTLWKTTELISALQVQSVLLPLWLRRLCSELADLPGPPQYHADL